ncbi:nitroreductase family protein [Nocardia gipuzkoensis]
MPSTRRVASKPSRSRWQESGTDGGLLRRRKRIRDSAPQRFAPSRRRGKPGRRALGPGRQEGGGPREPGAPHVALLFMPALGDGVRTAGDIGMCAQNFLLSPASRGFAGIPRTMLASAVRALLDVPADLELLFGISFGTADQAAPVNAVGMTRIPLRRSVVLHGTPGVLDGQ